MAMIEIDDDGALRLAAAIARQWIREQPNELPTVAAWLGIETDMLRQRFHPPAARRARAGWPACRGCGAPLPEQVGGGKKRQWCSEGCRRQANRRMTTR